jgi:hypothetical protein
MYDCNITLVGGTVGVESRALCDYANYHVLMFIFCGTLSALLMLAAVVIILCHGIEGNENDIHCFAKWSFICCFHSIGFEGDLACFYILLIVLFSYALITYFALLTCTVLLVCLNAIRRSGRRSNAVVSIAEHNVQVVVATDVCSICLENGGGDDSNPWFNTSCGHVFHLACIEKWRHSSCPLCRGATGLN